MRFEMKMPDLATTDSEIRIARWLIELGQKVERGQPLLEVETDKATMEVESVASGVLAEVLAAENDAVSVGHVIAVLDVEAAATGAVVASPPQISAASTATAAPVAGESTPRPAGSPAGMFARNRAVAAGARGAAVPAAIAGETPAPQAVAGIPLSVAQRFAAKRLQESKQTIPHFYLQASVNAAAVMARRKAAEPVKLAWDAFIVSAVAKAMAKYDRFRYRFDGERLTLPETDALGVAVDHENELYVIPVPSPAGKTVAEISDEIRHSAEQVRRGDPEARRLHPTLLTITNLGVCPIESFLPIINPPEAAVLGVGRVMPVPVVQADGRIGVEHRCTLSLSVDHRITSGKYAGDFLGAIVKELESM
jgi:pyruvate dehydrogenase E2 component (dihydrolipoamide acetyltransferase)